MRPHRSALTVLATIVLSLLAATFAGSAVGGGPTSVLLVAEGRTASLNTASADYQNLFRLLDADKAITQPPPGGSDGSPSWTVLNSNPRVTLTWLIHDVSVWRVDRVFPTTKGGPWISTQISVPGTDTMTEPPVWRHMTTGGKELTALFDRLGVGTAGGSVGSGTVTGQQQTGQQTGQQTASTPAADRTTGWPDGLIWGPIGALLGVALTLAVRSYQASPSRQSQASAADRSSGPVTGST